jgi:hypothetical protein
MSRHGSGGGERSFSPNRAGFGSSARVGGGFSSPGRTAAMATAISPRYTSPGREMNQQFTSPGREMNQQFTSPGREMNQQFTSPPRQVNAAREPPGAPRKENEPRHWAGRNRPPRTYLPPLAGVGTGLLLGTGLAGGYGYPGYYGYPSYPQTLIQEYPTTVVPVSSQQTPVEEQPYMPAAPTEQLDQLPIYGDTLRQTALNMDLETLANFCQTNSQTAQICSDDRFWKDVFNRRYPQYARQSLPQTVVQGLDSNMGRPLRSWREYVQLVSGMMYSVSLPVDIYIVEEARDSVMPLPKGRSDDKIVARDNLTLSATEDRNRLNTACIRSVTVPLAKGSDNQCVVVLDLDAGISQMTQIVASDNRLANPARGTNNSINKIFTGSLTFYYTSESTITDAMARFKSYAGRYALGIDNVGYNNWYYYALMPQGQKLDLNPTVPRFRGRRD